MTDLRALYQQVILEHKKHPRNFGVLASCTCHAKGDNPLCGDQIEVQVEEQDGHITHIAFQGDGCAISTASASLMTEAVLGKSRDEVEEMMKQFLAMVIDERSDAVPPESLGKLLVLAGVREFPSRVKCATLSWHTLKSALHTGVKVSTE